MKKFKNEVSVSEEMGSVINELIFRNLETDCNDYKVGDKIVYEWSLGKYFENDYGYSIDSIKEFVGKGVCLIDEELKIVWNREFWYNVSVKNNKLIVEFIGDESMSEKI